MECNIRKNTCGVKKSSVCITYEGELPEWSELNGEDCVVVEESLDELYLNVGNIKDSLDTSNLGNSCLKYPNNENILQKEVNTVFEKTICDLKQAMEDNISSLSLCDLDYTNLIENCEDKPKNFCELVQFILDEIKKLK